MLLERKWPSNRDETACFCILARMLLGMYLTWDLQGCSGIDDVARWRLGVKEDCSNFNELPDCLPAAWEEQADLCSSHGHGVEVATDPVAG